MATGADIPPELLRHILEEMCYSEHAPALLDPLSSAEVPNRKEAIKHVTACSLTCVYWAQICRKKLFGSVWIRSYEDMRAFSSLVANTPKRFEPISNYLGWASLEQRVGDRPWIHLLQMQPSLFIPLSDPNMLTMNIINDSYSGDKAITPPWTTHRRLFASLPRTPPSSCLQYTYLTIDNARFATINHLTSLLGILCTSTKDLTLSSITWDAQACFDRDLITSNALQIPENTEFSVTVTSSQYTAETSWLAFTARFCRISQPTIPPSPHSVPEKISTVLRILSPAQQAILAIVTLVLRAFKEPELELTHTVRVLPWLGYIILSTGGAAVPKEISTTMWIAEGAPDTTSRSLFLKFRHANLVGYGGPIVTVERISVLCIRVSTEINSTSPTPNDPSAGMQHVVTTYPWEDIIGICAEQEGFMRLQLTFESHDNLAQFIQAQRTALNRLNGRVCLFYQMNPTSPAVAMVDLETLRDMPGDAYREHGYIYL